MLAGKIVAGVLGLLVAGIPGLFFGLVLGHLFDRGLAATLGLGGAGRGELRELFLRTVFRLMGYLAKADGRVSEAEVAHTQRIFAQLGLTDEQRRAAIDLFKEGAEAGFEPEATARAFLHAGGAQPALRQNLFLFLVALAFADGELHRAERDALRRVGLALGYREDAVDELLRMATAQAQFHRGPGQDGAAPANAPTLGDAYTALGVSDRASNAEVKRAYRRLMSQNHPDKLSARGVPEHMRRLATEKSQEIQAAYELIRKSRGASKAG